MSAPASPERIQKVCPKSDDSDSIKWSQDGDAPQRCSGNAQLASNNDNNAGWNSKELTSQVMV